MEGYFRILFKLLDGYIQKWVMSFGFLYSEWCVVDGEIRKWHISSRFVYPEHCDLTYEYEYPEGNFFESLRTKQTFNVSVLGVGMNWYGVGRINPLLVLAQRII